jgi:xanthine dehydrogenase YagS FAD-binding subunit
MLPKLSYICPTSLGEALKSLALPGAHAHAGGTDLIGCLQEGIYPGGPLVSLRHLQELKGISPRPDGGLKIGALTTLAELASHLAIRDRYAALALGAASAASPQLRNQGTLGGNLCQRPRCWYFRGDFHCSRKGGSLCYAESGENENHAIFGGAGCYFIHPSDTASPLIALDARLRLRGERAERTIELSAFFVPPNEDVTRETVLKPGEIVAEILLPPVPKGLRSTYRKVRARGAWDFALAGVAVAVQITDGKVERARMVLSGVAPIPWRLAEAEAILIGQRLSADTAKRAAAAAIKKAEPMAKNSYKIELVQAIVEETLLGLA